MSVDREQPEARHHLAVLSRRDLRWLSVCHLWLLAALSITTPASENVTFRSQLLIVGLVGVALSVVTLLRPTVSSYVASTGVVFAYAVLRAAGFALSPTADWSSFDTAAGRIGVIAIWVYIILRNSVPPARRGSG